MTESRFFINFEDDKNNRDILLQILKHYQSIVHSSVGIVNGKLKQISNGESNLVLTNSSKNLMKILYRLNNLTDNSQKINDSNKKYGLIKWQLELIKSTISSSHLDHFYDSGLFLCHLVNELLICYYGLTSGDPFNDSEFKHIFIDNIMNNLLSHLIDSKSKENSLIKVKLDLNNLNFLKKLLESILNSKCIIQMMENSLKSSFVNIILKGFVKSFRQIPTETNRYFSNILYIFNENYSHGLDHSELIDGVLVKLQKYQVENELINSINNNKFPIRCCLFDSACFSGDFQAIDDLNLKFDISLNEIQKNKSNMIMLDGLIRFLDDVITKYDLKAVLCQKVIHPSIKSHLRKKDIICVDRLSITSTQPISELTGK